ncbi:MAG: chemotaxis protein CheX [Oscillospiraceae bacterium]
MFAQFFGSYLINRGIVTMAQLSEAFERKKTTRLRLGTIAMNEGVLTAAQVEEIHQTQMTTDRRFGDIAIEKGYLTKTKLEELLSGQPSDYLVLGQALADGGVLTNAALEDAIASYKKTNSLTDEDMASDKNDRLSKMISEFYHFENSGNAQFYTEYVTLLFRNLIRFTGDDFTPLETDMISRISCENSASQKIVGKAAYLTVIDTADAAFGAFAERFAGEEIADNEYRDSSVSEFLNLHNGLFIVNRSNDYGDEYQLTPPVIGKWNTLSFSSIAFSIAVAYSFGMVRFLITEAE